MAKSWEQQPDESDEWHGRFIAFLSLGVGRTLAKAYRACHPEGEATAVSGPWRLEARTRQWQKRANDHDLATFRESAREVVAAVGAGMVAVARKALEALESELPEMKPRDWGEALDAYRELRSLLPMDTIVAFANEAEKQGDPKAGAKPGDVDDIVDKPESFYLEQLPENGPEPAESPEEHLARTGHYPREVWVDPKPQPLPPA